MQLLDFLSVYPQLRLCSSLIGLLLLASPVGLASLGVRLLLARPRFPIFGDRPTSPFVPTMSAHARTASRKKNVKCEMPFLARHFLLSQEMF